MRLLNTKTRKLEEFAGDIPRYAILSHTWGKDEVSYRDINDSSVQIEDKQGYEKIRLACEQACDDSLDYVWIDTCCIDKSSSAELTEAINSMWTYYRLSNVCYAYLVDVTLSAKEAEILAKDHRAWNALQSQSVKAFLNSKWFRRGWTLQELIAPQKLVFYDKRWIRMGARNGRFQRLIRDITRIPTDILAGAADLERRLRHCSVAKRMSWAAERQTSRVEDQAYCLLGIFDVNMPMLYGEGHKAFRRLQEEIIKSSTDHSILARNIATGGILFATSAAEFRDCGNIDACPLDVPMEPYSMTNRGLMITLPILEKSQSSGTKYIEVILNCTQDGEAYTMMLQQLTQEPAPANLPKEYTVLPGPPRTRAIKAANQDMRRLIIVPRSLVASAEHFNAMERSPVANESKRRPRHRYNEGPSSAEDNDSSTENERIHSASKWPTMHDNRPPSSRLAPPPRPLPPTETTRKARSELAEYKRRDIAVPTFKYQAPPDPVPDTRDNYYPPAPASPYQNIQRSNTQQSHEAIAGATQRNRPTSHVEERRMGHLGS